VSVCANSQQWHIQPADAEGPGRTLRSLLLTSLSNVSGVRFGRPSDAMYAGASVEYTVIATGRGRVLPLNAFSVQNILQPALR
jgi:hypothetical protein